VTKIFKPELKEGEACTAKIIAEFRFKLRMAYFFYKRKKARWVSLSNKICSLVEQPIHFTDEYLTRKIDISFEAEGLPALALKLKPTSRPKALAFKFFACLATLWSLLLLVTETTLLFSTKDALSALLYKYSGNIWVIFSLTLVTLVLIIATAFFTIFKLKFSDYLQMVAGHTDAVTMASFVSLFSTLVSVACFNYMVMADCLEPTAAFHTSFLNFYSGMLQTPFLGDKLQHLLPGSIILFTLLFVILSIKGYESAAVKMMRSGLLSSQEASDVQALEKIYRGEIALLKDIKN
jgi:hypothetical protein